MTQSLVPQVKQINRAQIEEHLETNVVPLEEARKHESFNIGAGVNSYVLMFWKMSECIKDEGLTAVDPYCMHSQGNDGEWNFSWGLDNPITGESTRSCFYKIFPDGSVWCREYPEDQIQLGTVLNAWNLVCVIISDLIQSHDWDKQATADRLNALMQKAMNQEKA